MATAFLDGTAPASTDDNSFWRSGHTPTLIAAFLYFDLAFMVWVLLGPLAPEISRTLALTPAEKGLMVATPTLAGALLRVVNGLLERSARPASPSARHRRTHLWAVAREMPISAATWATGRPDSTRSTSRRLPKTVSRALRWDTKTSVWCVPRQLHHTGGLRL